MATASTKTAAKRSVKTAAKKTESAANGAVQASQDAFKTAEDFTAAAREQFESAMNQFTGASEEWREQAEDVTAELRERFEKNQQLASEMSTEIAEAAREEMSGAVQFANELGQAKTFADVLEIQRDYLTNLFEARMERTQALTGKSVEAAKEAFSPMTTDFGAFFDTNAFQKMFRFPTKA
ncbi:MAG: phasin family protein [Pseudomonadota bacterium]